MGQSVRIHDGGDQYAYIRRPPWETVFRSNARRDRPHFVRVVTKDLGVYHGNPLLYPLSGGDWTLVLDLAQREISPGKAEGADHSAQRPKTQCVSVGLDVHGKVVIASDQILAVEFRPKTLVGGKCEFRCDIPSDAKLCPP